MIAPAKQERKRTQRARRQRCRRSEPFEAAEQQDAMSVREAETRSSILLWLYPANSATANVFTSAVLYGESGGLSAEAASGEPGKNVSGEGRFYGETVWRAGGHCQTGQTSQTKSEPAQTAASLWCSAPREKARKPDNRSGAAPAIQIARARYQPKLNIGSAPACRVLQRARRGSRLASWRAW